MRILFVCSSGGHLAQLLALQEWWSKEERRWVTFDTADARAALGTEKVAWGHFPTTRNIPNLARNFALARRLLADWKPDVIMSTGAGIALPFFVLGRLAGVRTVYLEVYDRVDSATLTAKLVTRWTDLFLVQWDSQLEHAPEGAVVVGAGLVSAPKVVVSAGTDIHPFERLMGWVERWIAIDPQRATVWVQHGTSRLPQGAEGAELTSQEEMRRLMSEADVVVLQGGPGGMIDAWVCGQRPVVVPRVHDLGEHVDNHQVAFARHMAAQDRIDVAEDEAALHALLDAACAQPGSRRIEPYVVQSSETATRVGALVDDLVRSGRR